MECLRVGYEAPDGDLKDLKSQWLRYNHGMSRAVKAMTVDKRSGIYKSVCACAPKKSAKEWRDNTVCQAHIFVYRNRVTSVNLEHHCDASDPGRKRQYSVSMISLVSDEIREYDGPTKERGTAVQIYAEAAKAAGFEIGRTQAYKVLHEINQDPIEIHIGQYFLLSSALKTWRQADPEGTYEIETVPATWDDALDSFHRLYLAPSFAKHAWKHCHTRFVTLNASLRTEGHFSHQILLAVTYDSNDEILLLAAGICDEENCSNWLWFVQNLIKDFPGIHLVLSSSKYVMENEELGSLFTLIAAKRSWCLHRLIEEYPDKLSNEEKGRVVQMAQASTEHLYNFHLIQIKKENTNAATWFDVRKELFASHKLLATGTTRFGIIEDRTSNNETIREIMDIITNKPIATLLLTFMDKWLQIHANRKIVALHYQEQLNNSLVLNAHEKFKKKLNEAVQHNVQVIFNKDGIWRAYVAFSKFDQPMHRLLVSVNTSSFQTRCPCQEGLEMGHPCIHAVALLLAKDLNTDDARWFHERYHASTHSAMYGPPHFPHYGSLKGKLAVTYLAPPEHSRIPHKSNQKSNSVTANKESARICRACGKKGHHHKTCQNPSTEYQFERFATKAKKWAGDQTDLKAILD